MKTQNSVSQKISILPINKYILNINFRLPKDMLISMHSILGWASFCMNYCINAARHGDNQPVALLRCNEAQAALIAAFRSSALLGLVSLDSLWGSENTMDQHQQMTWQPKSSLTVETSHWTSSTWILCLSTLPPDSRTLIYKWNAKCTLIWKEDFGPLSNSPVLFLLRPGKMLLRMFLFQKWLGFPEDVWAWWLLMHWLQLHFSSCEALSSVWIGFAWQYSQACGHPCCLCTFSYPISSFQSTLHLICFDTALLEQPPPPPFQ